MGYRSMIYIAIKEDKVEEFKALLKDNLIQYIEQQEHDKTRFIGEELKWYDSYSDVRLINEFVDSNGMLIEIGEDGAIEERGLVNEFGIYTETTIKGF